MSHPASMGWIFTAVTIGITVVVFVAVFRWQARQRRERERLLTFVANQLGGRLEAGSFFRQPRISFHHGNHRASIEFYSTGGKHPTLYTRLFLHLSSAPPYRVRIYPERFLSRVGKWLGGQDIQLGLSDFDEKFMIKGSSPEHVRSFLRADVRQALFELRALKMNDHIEFTTDDNALRIQKLTWLDAADLLLAFATLGTQVFDGFLQAGAELPSGVSSPVDPARERCAVCADPVSGSSRACPACSAPHHPECFELNDGCGRCGASG